MKARIMCKDGMVGWLDEDPHLAMCEIIEVVQRGHIGMVEVHAAEVVSKEELVYQVRELPTIPQTIRRFSVKS